MRGSVRIMTICEGYVMARRPGKVPFVRSVADFMLDPSMGWIGAIDSLYFDQSHFVRDCKDFLGMSPSEYSAMDHPVIVGFMRERMRAHGSAVQTLDQPE